MRLWPPTRARVIHTDLLICADGGLRVARRLGTSPDLVIGDLDSASSGLLRWAAAQGATILRHPVEKDKIDAELALEAAADRGATEVEFVGVLGGRLDHTLAAVALLTKAESLGVRARIAAGRQEAFLARRLTSVPGRRGDTVSLIPMTSMVTGVTLHHFKYPLKNATIRQGTTLTISNVIEKVPATVRIRQGRLLIVIVHK